MTQALKPKITDLAETLAGAMPELAAAEQALAIALYRELARGNPVTASALGQRLDREEVEIDDTLRRWPGVYRNDAGRIVGFWGLALPEMPHRFRVDGRQLHTWCAWDALFIPELIAQATEVDSHSPASGEPVRLTVAPEAIEQLDPPEAVVSMLAPSEEFDQNMIASFCHFVHFFASPADAAPWLAEHPETFLLSVQEAFELGQLTNRARFADAIDAA